MIPNPSDFATLAATFGNHLTAPDAAFRGGDLYIRYPDSTLKNLTAAAGYGNAGQQSANAIAVRDPSVSWNGTKVIFSMLIGAPTQRYQVTNNRWQLYEITGLAVSETPVITKVANQSASYNNISPTYASDDSIIFTSDRPRDDSVLHTYPQRDEYESTPVVSGLWKLNPATGDLSLLDHAPSGNFNPIVDSFGRVIFTRWDHLQRDQQNLIASYGAFNYPSEASTTVQSVSTEVFPEPRSNQDPDYQTKINLFTINQFFPWMMNQDGTEMETLNHIGRQEIGLYSERSFNDDPNVQEFYGQYSTGINQNEFTIFLHIKEKPTTPGTYLGTSCQEFGTHSAGQIISITGAPGVNPDAMVVSYLTHPDTSGASDSPSVNHSGLYRDPLPLSNGALIASHTANTRQDSNIGSSSAPASRYDFRLKVLTPSGQYLNASALVTSGISKSVVFWSPDESVSYNGPLWEMMPVELKSRSRPTSHTVTTGMPAIEAAVLSSLGISETELKNYLVSQNLALIVSRNVTARDRNDRQQPSNLRVTGTSTQTIPNTGKIYDISKLKIFQGDLIRGYSTGNSTGRRVLAQPMHSVGEGINIDTTDPTSVAIASDGSMAAFVPARRALSWQLNAPDGSAVVRERYWLTFQPGEIRVCASCHGINTGDQIGRTEPTNSPKALLELLAHWKNLPMPTPTPNPTATPEPAPISGTYKLEIRNLSKGILRANGRFAAIATGADGKQSTVLRVKINGISCSKSAAFKRAAGARKLSGRFPNSSGNQIIFFVTLRGSSVALASKTVTLRGQARSRDRSTRGVSSLCKSLIGSL